MSPSPTIRPTIRLSVHMALAVLLVWLGAHIIGGKNGLLALQARKTTIATQQQALDQILARNGLLQTDIARLQPPLDFDFLEERARMVLGYVARDESVILLKDKSP